VAARRAIGTGAAAGADGTRGGGPGRHLDLPRPRVLLGWLAAIPHRLGDRLFAMNDAEARWHSWQTTGTHGGLGRRYRDPQFATLVAGPKRRGEVS